MSPLVRPMPAIPGPEQPNPASTWIPPEGMLAPVVHAWRNFYRRIWNNYGMTPEQYRVLYIAQLGRCYICQRTRGMHPDDPKGKGRRLGVDHNHMLGNRIEAVRGLLCPVGDKSCNRIIGWLDYRGLERAAGYVKNPPARFVLAQFAAGKTAEELQGVAYESGG